MILIDQKPERTPYVPKGDKRINDKSSDSMHLISDVSLYTKIA